MKELTLKQIADWCGGTVAPEYETVPVTGVESDSRKVEVGDLFVALRGERVDGHDFIPSAKTLGASAALVSRPSEELPCVVVESPLRAYGEIAKHYREMTGVKVVGITGSVGKTTTKEMIASVVSQRYRTLKTAENFNNDIGTPLTLLGLDDTYEAAVIETGMDHFGEIRYLGEMVRPHIAVITNIGDAHLEALGDRPGILRAKSEILQGMGPDAVIFANGDDALLSAADFGRKTVLFGLGENCAVRAADVRHCGESLSCCILAGERSFPVTVPAYGTYMIYSVLAAAAVSLELGLSDAEIARGLARYETVGRRSRVVKTGYCTLVDDCYNANPTSDRAAIDSLASLSGRHVCILGDMLEMGGNAPELHRSVGEYAAAHGVDLVITQGELAKYIAEGAGTAGVHYADRASLLAALPELLHEGDVVLVKASHGAHFEEISEAVKQLS